MRLVLICRSQGTGILDKAELVQPKRHKEAKQDAQGVAWHPFLRAFAFYVQGPLHMRPVAVMDPHREGITVSMRF